MGAVPPAKVAKLLRQMTRPALPAPPAYRPPVLSFEARNGVVLGRIGDDVVWNCVAPSASAARAIMKALRALQAERGTIFDPKGT